MSLGNETDARIIWAWARGFDEMDLDNEWDAEASAVLAGIPEGFEFVASGAYRHAFRKDGLIYKVDNRWSKGSNLEEYVNVCRFSYLGYGYFSVPRSDCYFMQNNEAVIVMEDMGPREEKVVQCNRYGQSCVCGAVEVCVSDIIPKWRVTTGVFDIHAGNVRVRDGIAYIIDLGYDTLMEY